jgi:ectoine hydroxylase-related dioxygenase (phytanoyl-CoA dioxygenase family)
LVDEHRDAAGEVGIGLNEVMNDTFVIEVFTGEITQSISSDLANEVGRHSTTTSPYGDVGGTSTGGQHHFTKRVATLEYVVVRADENVPRKVANDAQTHTITLPTRVPLVTISVVSVSPTTSLDDVITLSRETIEQYQNEGHAVVRQLASQSEIDTYAPAIADATYRSRSDERPLEDRDTYGKAFIQSMNLWMIDARVREFVFARRFAKVAADLMGVDGVRLYHDQSLFKEPGGGITPWHQDQVYWPLDTNNTITMWMPLVDVPTEVGSVVFASRSQHGGDLGGSAIGDDSQAYFEHLIEQRRFETVSHAPMRAGDATFHSGWTLHGAPANETTTMRSVMTIIYFADGARVGPLDSPMRRNDHAQWLDSLAVGAPAASRCNPLLWSR